MIKKSGLSRLGCDERSRSCSIRESPRFDYASNGTMTRAARVRLELVVFTSCVFNLLFTFNPWYQITNSSFVFPYISYISSGEKLLKYQ